MSLIKPVVVLAAILYGGIQFGCKAYDALASMTTHHSTMTTKAN
jgi:hypothetical protein